MTQQTKRGFTIIETTLATMFLGIIILSVANLIIQITNIYQKGLNMRAVNSSGQQIVEDMEKRINSADYVYDIDTNHDGYILNKEIVENIHHYFREWNVADNDVRQRAGAFCVSDYSYVWNTPVSLRDNTTNGVFITTNVSSATRYKLARVYDPTHLICQQWLVGMTDTPAPDKKTSANARYDIVLPINEAPVDLLNEDSANLAIYDLTVHPITQSTITKQSFVSVSFILATIRGNVNIMSSGDYCQGTDDLTGTDYNSVDFAYCAVNKFDFSMRTGGNTRKNG